MENEIRKGNVIHSLPFRNNNVIVLDSVLLRSRDAFVTIAKYLLIINSSNSKFFPLHSSFYIVYELNSKINLQIESRLIIIEEN